VKKRTTDFRRTPNGLAANRPLPWIGNALCSYLTGKRILSKQDLSQILIIPRRLEPFDFEAIGTGRLAG
jgi:hypothetical protein